MTEEALATNLVQFYSSLQEVDLEQAPKSLSVIVLSWNMGGKVCVQII